MGAASVQAGSGLFKFLNPRRRPQSIDLQAAATWGAAAATGAIWLVQLAWAISFAQQSRGDLASQPFDWLKKTFFEKPAEEK
ncbi:hypothetical protein Scep_005893 [Stephania cephalantha]|uniref:Uncharacterized protein n=1 Tax=Stephania cephalantha TaxID=152367 RepID=A0AAP0KWW7_9MAGN